MKGEITREFYCLIDSFVKDKNGKRLGCSWLGCGVPSQATIDCTKSDCGLKKHKYPTPEQFREEYGHEYPDDGAVWWRVTIEPANYQYCDWHLGEYKDALDDAGEEYGQIVCACTHWGKPPDDYKPGVQK